MARRNGATSKELRLFVEQVAAGCTFQQAAVGAGHESPGVFYRRANRQNLNYDEVFAEALAEAMEQRAAIRADRVDGRFDDWIDDPECPAQLRIAWAKRWNPAYRDQHTLEVTGVGAGGAGEDRSASLADIARILEAAGALAQLGGRPDREQVPDDRQVLPAPVDA